MSSLSCELYGIFSALKYVRSENLSRAVVISDARFPLRDLSDRLSNSSPHPLMLNMVRLYLELRESGKLIEFLWVPAHMDISGNERADRLARDALGFQFGNFSGAPFCDHLSLFGIDYES